MRSFEPIPDEAAAGGRRRSVRPDEDAVGPRWGGPGPCLGRGLLFGVPLSLALWAGVLWLLL